MRRFYKLPFRKELLCKYYIILVSIFLLLVHGINGAEARAAVQKTAAPTASATSTGAPAVVLLSGADGSWLLCKWLW